MGYNKIPFQAVFQWECKDTYQQTEAPETTEWQEAPLAEKIFQLSNLCLLGTFSTFHLVVFVFFTSMEHFSGEIRKKKS